MHLNLNSIKVEKFRLAEGYLEIIKNMFEHNECREAFVRSSNFLQPGLNGK